MNHGRHSQNKKLILSNLSRNYNIKENVIKINRHNSTAHELSKCIVALEIAKNGSEFYSEAIFKSGQRCDLIDVNSLMVVEILHSETDEMLKKNKKDYPFPILTLKADDVLEKFINKYNDGDII